MKARGRVIFFLQGRKTPVHVYVSHTDQHNNGVQIAIFKIAALFHLNDEKHTKRSVPSCFSGSKTI